MQRKKRGVLAVGLAVLGSACGAPEGGSSTTGPEQDAVRTGTGMSYEAFLAQVYREPDSGLCILNGDEPMVDCDEKHLQELYGTYVREGQLIVNRIYSGDDRWSDAQKLNLTYCVSNTFGTNKAAVVNAMASAAAAWAAAANVKFTYVPAQDAGCTASNTAVLFDVNPVNANGQYAARSFFPSTSRSARNVLIDASAFASTRPTLTGILRHELGHTLGFRHEHTRPEAATCFEDNNWRGLTPYDSASVMHYPQCNGTANTLELTQKDVDGARSLYGAPGTAPAPTPAPAPGTAQTETFSGSLARGQQAAHGPFSVVAGTTFEVVMTGSGDPDLYVRFGAAPTLTSYACRPYKTGASETCSLTVPSGQSSAYVMVNGYASGTYALTVRYTRPGTSTADTQAPTFAGLASATAVGSSQVNLAWAAATDDLSAQGALVYDVYVSTSSTVPTTPPTFSTAPGATSAQVTGLSPGTAYSFVVRARDAAGNRDANTVVRSATTAQPTPTPTDPNAAFEDRVLELVNQARAAGATCGTTAYAPAPALALDARLRTAARLHSQDMADQNYFSHTSLDGRSPGDRMAAAGYTGGTWGENIAAGQTTPESVMQGWMASAGHCTNIMNPNYRLIGVGYGANSASTYRVYWTQDFGR
ncbi:matrixin family metalloprotease [Aggregicoccus sp. 17bor-14]|uniref:M57 family metalloprotease n=1 Tax=Myxococcaceae TaxID=31 RepID=UPI00129CBDBD|nr:MULTISPECIES: M57 family metalloprotease [Myxococcaceae]MBF5044841.1 matrixin family metalloprotease [Simulacricoccus sp. 17bor-14]MRI90585.1 matrixin family metalloprotease [Aggregicoccus sp. 17bor-14]